MCACQYSGGRGGRIDAAINGIGREGRASKNRGWERVQRKGGGWKVEGIRVD
jgi:hypothetical protein